MGGAECERGEAAGIKLGDGVDECMADGVLLVRVVTRGGGAASACDLLEGTRTSGIFSVA